MTSAATQATLWYAMRASSMALAACVLVHLATIVYAVRGGLSAAEILHRTHGNWLVGAFYGVFVIACAVHVPLGLAAVAEEWLGVRERTALVAAQVVGLAILVMGLRAVYAVVAG
ncbi:MAG: succinate dehydrogenase [Burkholderiales bacterium]|nr:succinate dehydrogenase [Burkholderiales bacterium]